MNAIFDIKRFLNLEKRNLLTHKNQFLYASLILLGYFIFSVLFTLLIGIGQILVLFIYPLAFAVIICAPCFFEKSMQKHNSIFDFILPGSTFEKYLIMLINYVIILPVFCFGIIFLLSQLMSILPNETLNALAVRLSLADNISWTGFYKMLMFQSIFMVGYFYFKRFSFIKTTLILFAFAVVFQIIFLTVSFIAFKNASTFNEINMMSTSDSEFGDQITKATRIPTTIIAIIMPLGLWIVSFLKMREKEI